MALEKERSRAESVGVQPICKEQFSRLPGGVNRTGTAAKATPGSGVQVFRH
jgi:hypothetical protein